LTAAGVQPASLKANKALVREVFAAFQSADVAVFNRTFLAAKSVEHSAALPSESAAASGSWVEVSASIG
jgi:hypothetical protein